MGGIDRISALPNEVVCHILSLMPTKFAVRTTVLSKRWNNKWTCVPNLDLSDLRDFCADYQGGSDRFATFVSRVLYFRDSLDIPKCSLLLFSPHDLSRIDDWVCAIVRRNVVEFEFSFDICVEAGESPFPIPRSFLMCKTLRVLKLNLWASDFTIDPPESGCFPRLKVLHLRVCSLNVPLMEKLYSCCPVLEVLTIEGIMDLGYADNDVLYNFKISALELKTLRIDLVCQFYNTRLHVYISAPKLENLDLKMDGFSNYFLMGRAKSLVNASIGFTDFFEEERPYFSNQAITLLDEVSNAQYLSLSARWSENWHLPAFDNLNQLTLDLWDCNYWELLAEFLHNAPNLKDFVLDNRTELGKEYSEHHWNPPKDVPTCLSSHLKSISISGFKGRPVEMKMAKYLLKNGRFLTKMTIYTDILYAVQDLYEEFSMFHTTACRVELIKSVGDSLGMLVRDRKNSSSIAEKPYRLNFEAICNLVHVIGSDTVTVV